MAGVLSEDAATVLDQFVHDVANLPAEIAHLLQEIQAKDERIAEARAQINQRDVALQKFAKANGGHNRHPKEPQIIKEVQMQYDIAQTLQEEKCALANKSSLLLDKYVKRLDIKIRDLQTEGQLGPDPSLPSLLHDSAANRVPASTNSTGVTTPIHPVASTTGGGQNLAHAAMQRMANQAALQQNASIAQMGGSTPPHPPQRQREMSAGATIEKRRRLNASLGALPTPSSGLARHSSLGPGTPKASTPTGSSRAGSAGPRTKKAGKQLAPHQASSMRKKIGKSSVAKKAARRLGDGKKGTPSTTGDDEDDDGSDESGSGEEAPTGPRGPGKDGAGDDDGDVGAEGDDETLYCTCQTPSHGNMVACDNEACPFEWFHWDCVGLKEEPKGRWLCPNCKKLPSNQLKLAR